MLLFLFLQATNLLLFNFQMLNPFFLHLSDYYYLILNISFSQLPICYCLNLKHLIFVFIYSFQQILSSTANLPEDLSNLPDLPDLSSLSDPDLDKVTCPICFS